GVARIAGSRHRTVAALIITPKKRDPRKENGVRLVNALSRKEKWIGYLFILPLCLQFIVFMIGPLIYSLYISMTDWNIFGNARFVGLENYLNMLQNERFWAAMKNTAFYLWGIPIGLSISMVLAVWMNRGIPGISI